MTEIMAKESIMIKNTTKVTSTGQEVTHLSWDIVHSLALTTAAKVSSSPDYKHLQYVAGIPRGGLILATILSHATSLKYVPFNEHAIRPDVLLVDDINDSGNTFKDITSSSSLQIQTACLVQRVSSSFKCSYIGVELYTDSWIVFPWESGSTFEREHTISRLL